MTALKTWIPALGLILAQAAWAASPRATAIELDALEGEQSAFHKVAGPRACPAETALYVMNSANGKLESLTLENFVDIHKVGGEAYFDDVSETSKSSERLSRTQLQILERAKDGRATKTVSFKISATRTSKSNRILIEQSWKATGSLCQDQGCRGRMSCTYEYVF